MSNCDGHPFTFHAEYNTARKQNMVPWTALEAGVLMEQEIGHFETCDSLRYRDGFKLTGASPVNAGDRLVGRPSRLGSSPAGRGGGRAAERQGRISRHDGPRRCAAPA